MQKIILKKRNNRNFFFLLLQKEWKQEQRWMTGKTIIWSWVPQSAPVFKLISSVYKLKYDSSGRTYQIEQRRQLQRKMWNSNYK